MTRSKTTASSRHRRLIAIKDLSHCEIFLSSNSKISAGENLRMSSGRNKGCNEAEDGGAVTSGVAAVIIKVVLSLSPN